MNRILCGIVFAIVSVSAVWPRALWLVLFLALLIASLCLGFSGTIAIHLIFSTRYVVKRYTPSSAFDGFHKFILQRFNEKQRQSPERLPVVFGRSVDLALQELLDLIVKDLISPWLQDLAFESKLLQQNIKSDIWYALGKLSERLASVDETRLIAVDMISKITQHFEQIRIAQSQTTSEMLGNFYLAHHLGSSDKEVAYLRKFAELVLVTLFPRKTITPSVNKTLLIEILTCKVFLPCVTLVTDPDFINLQLMEYLEHVQRSQDMHRRSYAHAESYVEFIQLIRASDNVDHLKHIRYTIMTEIMQATTILNLKKAKGVDGDRDQESSKKLRKYLSQLSFAKAHCESRLQALDCLGFSSQDSDGSKKMVVPLTTVLESVDGRKRLGQFLELSGEEALLAFWAAVEELRSTEKKNWHQIGAEIYYTFLHSPLSVIKVEKPTRRRIESFLLGNSGPDVFYEIEESVIEKLQNKIYPSFLATDLYLRYLQDIDRSLQNNLCDENQLFGEDEKEDSAIEQSGYARSKLSQLEEKLSNKSQALQALRASLKPESKVLTGLEKEVEHLEGEKRQLEAHLTRTEAWGEHLGKWRAVVQSVEVPEEKEQLQFVLVVHVLEDDQDSEAISTGWVVLRKLSEFHDLHRKLVPLWAGVKHLELPTLSPKFIFGKQLDKNGLDKAKLQVQKFLEGVLKEEQVNACEAVYTFLSPSSQHLKSNADFTSPKKAKFSFTTLFKGGNTVGGSEGSRESDEEDGSLLDDATGSGEGRDAVAEPLYALLGEVFDLRGVFRWLRKTLIAFVQITYGRTISRQVGETAAWVVSEPMVHYYIQLFTQAWWPNGTLASPRQLRTFDEKLKTRQDAKDMLRNNTPEFLNNLVGLQNARRGMVKVFETMQDVRLNKQIFYEIFELAVYELFPELRRKHPSASPAKRSKVKP